MANSASRAGERTDFIRLILDLVGVVLILMFLAGFVSRNVTHQGDLKTYQLAAHAALNGLDPYQPETLSSLAGRRVFPFVYPPIALLPFIAVADLPAKLIANVWMWGKIGLLGLLLLLWSRSFVPGSGLLPLALVATFGWNSSAQWDLASGNVAIIECALLWSAFALFVAGRRTWFALLAVAAGCFKLMPAAFLLLLLVPHGKTKPSPGHLAFAVCLLAVLVMGPVLALPTWQPFWYHVPNANSFGDSNPSAIGFLVVMLAAAGLGGPVLETVAMLLWGIYLIAVVAISLPMLRRLWSHGTAVEWVMSSVFLYVLLTPRPMAYGFALLAPAPLFFAPRPFSGRVGVLLLGLLFSAQGLYRLTGIHSGSPLVTYAPFLLTLCVWLLVLNHRLPDSRHPLPTLGELR